MTLRAFAIGSTTNDVLTARTVYRAIASADIPPGLVLTGEQSIEIPPDLVPAGGVHALIGRRFNVAAGSPVTLVAMVAATVANQKTRIYNAAQLGFTNNRRHWAHLSTNGDQAGTAVDRWIVHVSAGGDLIVDGAWRDASNSLVVHTPEHRESIVVAIEETMSGTNPTSRGDIPTWYQVMEGNATLRTQWRTAGVTAGSLIYADFLTATGDLRTPDGAFIATNNTIPTGFDIDSPTLRSS